jgi:hypothetical protein
MTTRNSLSAATLSLGGHFIPRPRPRTPRPSPAHPSSNLRRAKKRLTATVTKSEFGSSRCKQTLYQNPNRNKIDVSENLSFLDLPTYHSTLTIIHCISPARRSMTRLRRRSNRPYRRLEINISPTKQRTAVVSNRSKSGVIWRQNRSGGNSKSKANSRSHVGRRQASVGMTTVRQRRRKRRRQHQWQSAGTPAPHSETAGTRSEGTVRI